MFVLYQKSKVCIFVFELISYDGYINNFYIQWEVEVGEFRNLRLYREFEVSLVCMRFYF